MQLLLTTENFQEIFDSNTLALIKEYLSKYCNLQQLLYLATNNSHYVYNPSGSSVIDIAHHSLIMAALLLKDGYQVYSNLDDNSKVAISISLKMYHNMANDMIQRNSFVRDPLYDPDAIPDALKTIS